MCVAPGCMYVYMCFDMVYGYMCTYIDVVCDRIGCVMCMLYVCTRICLMCSLRVCGCVLAL